MRHAAGDETRSAHRGRTGYTIWLQVRVPVRPLLDHVLQQSDQGGPRMERRDREHETYSHDEKGERMNDIRTTHYNGFAVCRLCGETTARIERTGAFCVNCGHWEDIDEVLKDEQ